MPALVVALVIIGGIGVMISNAVSTPDQDAVAELIIPNLSPAAETGKQVFDNNCAACHGANASGTDMGPPLAHTIYNPGHHSDAAFFIAAKNGVRRHHWNFGDMPPQSQVSEDELTSLVSYIRELQVANGITYQPHNM